MTQKKKITFVRHAKSSWAEPGLADVDRPLNPRGIRDRALMAARFKEDFYVPDLLLCSHAKRAYDTATSFAKAFGYSTADIIVENKLYHASVDDMDDVILEQSDELNSIMLFSHNPGLTYMINEHAGQPIDNVPTAGIFTLEAEVSSWSDFLRNCNLLSFIYPKMYV